LKQNEEKRKIQKTINDPALYHTITITFDGDLAGIPFGANNTAFVNIKNDMTW
jgi:hypothetical protein